MTKIHNISIRFAAVGLKLICGAILLSLFWPEQAFIILDFGAKKSVFLNLNFFLFLVLVSTQLTFPKHFLYRCGGKQTDRGNFRLSLEGLLYSYEKSHISETKQNRKFDNNDRFKERKQLRLLLQWLKHRLRKTSLEKYQKRTKEPNDETHKDTVCLLALIWLKLYKDP